MEWRQRERWVSPQPSVWPPACRASLRTQELSKLLEKVTRADSPKQSAILKCKCMWWSPHLHTLRLQPRRTRLYFSCGPAVTSAEMSKLSLHSRKAQAREREPCTRRHISYLPTSAWLLSGFLFVRALICTRAFMGALLGQALCQGSWLPQGGSGQTKPVFAITVGKFDCQRTSENNDLRCCGQLA